MKGIMDKQVSVFRIIFGAMMTVHVIDLITSGAAAYYFIDPVLHLKYPLLEWVASPSEGMVMILGWALVAFSVALSLGLATRLSSLAITVLYGWLLWSDVSFFKHHHYLFWLITLLLAIIPSNRVFSVDQIIKFDPKQSISSFELLVLRVMMVIPYFYGGISKLINPEWTSGKTVSFILEQKFGDQAFTEPLSAFMTYGGMTFDLIIPILFFIPRLRIVALILALGFNVTNFFLFTIDVFPFVMLAGTLLFVNPGFTQDKNTLIEGSAPILSKAILSIFLIFQLLFPLRHLVIPGNVFLTGEGYMAGWNMIDSLTRTDLDMTVVDQEKNLQYSVEALDYLTKRQASTVGRFPEFLPQVADHIAAKASVWNIKSAAVMVKVNVSRNGEPPVMVVDDKMNLVGQQSDFLSHSSWIIIN